MHSRLLIIVILLSLLLGIFMLRSDHDWGDDFASYIMQAESIVNHTTREFLKHNTFTIHESSSEVGPVAYPWGYPLILAPVVAMEGINPLALKLPGLFFYAGFVVCVYLLIKTRLSQLESLLIASLFAFNPLMLGFLNQILSDIPFLFFCTLALLLMVLHVDGKLNTAGYVTLGFSIACAFFIRVTGILLLASFLAWELIMFWKIQKNRRQLKKLAVNVLIVAATFAFLWLLYILFFPGGGTSYFAQYRQFKPLIVLLLIFNYIQAFSAFLGGIPFWDFVYYLFIPLFLIGAWKRRKDDLILILFFIFWMIVLITWPFWQGVRFLFPVLPIFGYFIFQGIKLFLEKMPIRYARAGQWMFYSFWALIAINFLMNACVSVYTNARSDQDISGPFDPYSKEVYKYIQEQTPADSVVIFFKPRVMKLMTDRDTIMSTECERMYKGDYLVLSRKVGRNQQIPPDEIEACNLPLKEVLRNNDFIVYQLQNNSTQDSFY